MILYCKFVILYMENYTWEKIKLYMTVKQQLQPMIISFHFMIECLCEWNIGF